MALVVKDRVKETSTTVGTGTFTLAGAANGFQSFAVIGDGNTTYYTITDGTDWEVGIGTYTSSGTTLSRDTILESSNSGNAVNWGAGSKDVFITYPAEQAVYFNAAGQVDVDNLRLDGNTLSSTNTDGNVVLDPNGTGSVDVSSAKIINVATPTSGNDAVNKTYVDSLVASGIHFHQPVRVESPINLVATYDNGTAGVGATLENADTQAALVIDGVTLSVNDRVLIYQQTDQTENGVYVVTDVGSVSTNWILTRASDADTYVIDSPNGLSEGSTFFVQQGTTGAGETYTCNTSGVITFGTTNITFVQVSSAQIYSAGAGLDLTGTQFSVETNGITNAMLRQSAGLSVIGRSANSTGDVADITAASDNEVLRRSGTSIGFGTVATGGIADDAVTNDKLRESAALSVIGNATNATANPADIVASDDGQVLRRSTTSIGFGALALNNANAVTGALPFDNGGTGQTSQQAAMNALAGAITSGQYLRGNGTNVVMAALAAGDLTGTVAVANGGTGQTSYTNGELLIGNTTGNTLTKATLTAGTGISITNGTGSITIAASGSGTTILDDTTTNATRYLTFANATSGTFGTAFVSSSKLTFNPSTGALSIGGDFTTPTNIYTTVSGSTSSIEAGRGTGSVALTTNDGYGNANVAFNHRNGIPDVTGSSARIQTNVDSATAGMQFQLANSVTAGVAAPLTTMMSIASTGTTINSGTFTVGSTSSIRQPTSTWTGDPGAGTGKLEYHSNRWYVVAGSDSTEVARFRRNNADVGSIANDGRLNFPFWSTTGRNYSSEWIELPNFTGIYSPNNNAHFYPNNGSYGSWRIDGTRNSWAGIEFNATVSLMMNRNTVGIYDNAFGWTFYWTNGSLVCFKNANGGGTAAIVHDDVNCGRCRAWVNFNGTGAVAIRAAFNVSSITDLGVGLYRANFTSAMPDNNYAFTFGVQRADLNDANFRAAIRGNDYTNQVTTTYVEIGTGYSTQGQAVDALSVSCAIFR